MNLLSKRVIKIGRFIKGNKMNVLLLRGFQGNLFSTGLDRLAEKLTELGYDVEVDGYESFLKHYNELKDKKEVPVLIGHSFGALSCYKIVSLLHKKKFPLVVSLDYSPYYSGLVGHVPDGVVPSNVLHALNFYQKVDPLVRGVVMKRKDHSEKGIRNVKTNHVHVEIDKANEVHDEIIKALKSLDT